jgi:hypothetical protein
MLSNLFRALQMVYYPVRKRNKPTTFVDLKPAVEEAWGRRFKVSRGADCMLPAFLLAGMLAAELCAAP